jgi:hypothetical protein
MNNFHKIWILPITISKCHPSCQSYLIILLKNCLLLWPYFVLTYFLCLIFFFLFFFLSFLLIFPLHIPLWCNFCCLRRTLCLLLSQWGAPLGSSWIWSKVWSWYLPVILANGPKDLGTSLHVRPALSMRSQALQS